jgi:hypothetical protein
MWNDYYDKVKYEAKSNKLDAAGNEIYEAPRNIGVRHVSGGQEQVIKKDNMFIKYTKEYQIPFMVAEGDKIDGHNVVYAEPSRDVFGTFHFCIAKVE